MGELLFVEVCVVLGGGATHWRWVMAAGGAVVWLLASPALLLL